MDVETFVMEQLGYDRGFAPCSWMGFEVDGKLVAGVIFHNWNPESGVIELTAASSQRRWLTKQRLRDIFAYPFYQLECRMAVARISEHNATTRKIWRSLGAKEHVLPELRGPQENEIVSILRAEDWAQSKFLWGPKHGQTKASRAA